MPISECPECEGTGALVIQVDRFTTAYERCPACDGTGVRVSLDDEEEPRA